VVTIKKITSIIMAVIMSLAVFTGCSGRTDSQGDSSDIVQKEYNYLTGLPFADNADKSARPIAVMINNAKVALPQSGLTNADIIYEAVTEGGITRLMALYSDINVIDRVGPVRSARDQFVEMMLPLNAIYVHIGSSASAKRMLNGYSYQDIDGIYLGFLSFAFDDELAKTKASEHCWFTNTDLIKAGIEKNSIKTKNDFYPAFDFVDNEKDARILDGESANTITFSYSGYADVGFVYDAATGKYLKTAFGTPHMDADTNQQLSFDNVFIITTEVGVQEENGILPDFEFESGSGYYFHGGRYEQITWEKGQPENPLILYDTDGNVLKVNTGKSYIGLLDEERTDTIVISEVIEDTVSVERVQ